MKEGTTPLWLRRTVLAGLLGALLLLGFVVMRPFLAPIAWAAILTYVLWPVHLRLLARTRGSRAWAALAMTATLTLALSAALLWLGLLLRSEGVAAFREVAAVLQAGVDLPEPIARIPWLGRWLQERLTELGSDRDALGRQLSELADQWGGHLMRIVGDLGLNVLRFAVSLVTAFFLFRDGDRLLEELRRVLNRMLGDRVRDYFNAIGDTTRAVVYGLLLAAIAQGVMAGLGYWAVGVKAPVFWGAATAMVALLPWGAPVVWGAIGAWLVLRGDVGAGLGLLLWGALAVSWIDNLVRPLVISGVARVPFLLVLFGVLGGLAAFGLIGLFVGPVALAILVAVWREWVTATLQD
ncbi:MAG TPA: AI-2E family transporter [Burkholderiaceae bacterium]|nr:AI-2E family transporter [Burkholderiaceae bacterium]